MSAKAPFTMKVNGIIIPGNLKEKTIKECLSFVPNRGDVIVVTYPKSGTNFAAQLVSLIQNQGKPPQNIEEYFTTCPFFDYVGPEGVRHLKTPRSYKMHFNYQDAPKSKDAKYICVIRNPKDCLTSLYYYMKNDTFKFKDGTFADLFSLFVEGEVIYNNYFDHLLSWYEHRHDDNVLYLYYEKMKFDLEDTIRSMAAFMGPDYEELLKDETVFKDVVKYSSVDYMKRTVNGYLDTLYLESMNPENERNDDDKSGASGHSSVTGDLPKLVRKGIVGDWRNVFTAEQSKLLDEIMERRIGGTEMYRYWKDNCYV